MKTLDTHVWEDISRHGSAWYSCRCCGAWEHDVRVSKVSPECPKAEAWHARQKKIKEDQERVEHGRLKAQKERERYLIQKFGPI